MCQIMMDINLTSLKLLDHRANIDNVLYNKAVLYNMYMQLNNSKQPLLLNQYFDSHWKCGG